MCDTQGLNDCVHLCVFNIIMVEINSKLSISTYTLAIIFCLEHLFMAYIHMLSMEVVRPWHLYVEQNHIQFCFTI